MEQPSGLRQYLEMCKRMGVRYLSVVTEKPSSPDPISDSAPIPKPEEPKESFVSERSADYTPHQPKWMTLYPETIQAMELMAFEKDICECQKCPLGKTRTNFVFGSGSPKAEVLFVGEAPGADEDQQGLPFVGRAGQLLTKIIESTQTWKRQDVFIANVLKCRPPGNRTTLPEEVEVCRGYLEEQIKILKPKLIMAMGASAAQALLRTKDAVGKLRGKWHDLEGIPLRVTYHPAALLRDERYKKDVWEDMKEMTRKYKGF